MLQLFNRFRSKTEFLQLSAVTNQGIVALIGLLRTVIVVRLLSPEEYGIIGIAIAVGSAFSIFQNLGLGVGAAKEAAQSDNPARLGLVAFVLVAVRLVMLLPLLGVLILFAAPQAVALYRLPQLDLLLWLYALFILVSSPGDILGYVLTGSSRFRPYFALRLANEVFVTVTICWMIWRWHVIGYFIGQAVAGGGYTLVSLIVVWRVLGLRIERVQLADIITLLKSVFRTSLSVYAAKLCRSFSLQIPVLVGGVYLSMTAVGSLKFGMQAGGYVATLLSAIQLVNLPRMTRYLHSHGQEYMLERFGRNYLRVTVALSCVLVSAVALAPELIILIAGSNFANSIKPFQLMVIFYTLTVLADTIFSGVHFPLDREGSYVASYVSFFCISVAASYLALYWMRVPESAVYGLCVGAAAHYAIALLQTKTYAAVFPMLVQATARILGAALLAMACLMVTALHQRIALAAAAIVLILLDMVRNESAFAQRVARHIAKR